MAVDDGIENLLDLHDQVIEQSHGYWIKIEAWAIEVTNENHPDWNHAAGSNQGQDPRYCSR